MPWTGPASRRRGVPIDGRDFGARGGADSADCGEESIRPYSEPMSEENAISVNFSKPMPLFPLEGVTLLPQQFLPLHIFEPRYRQMVERALDGSGQIAMAVFKGDRWKQEYHARPPLMDAVCVGQIVQHERLPDGRFNLLLQGVCRARIAEEAAPDEGRLFRMAKLEPVGLSEEEAEDSFAMDLLRARLGESLDEGPLSKLADAPTVLEFTRNTEIPTSTLVDLWSFTLVFDRHVRYRLLAEGSLAERARIVEGEIEHLERMIRRGIGQHPEQWPKGCSWN